MIGGPLSAFSIYQREREADTARRLSDENAKRAAEAQQKSEIQAKIAKANAEQAAKSEANAMDQQKNAVDALKSLVFEVQRNVGDDPRFMKLRTSLLQVASDGLHRMEQSANDVDSQNMIAAGIERRLGDINFELGRIKEAFNNYNKCLDIVKALDEKGQLANRRHNLSTSYELVGLALKKLGDYKAAEENLLQALEVRRKWAQEAPDDKGVPLNIATSLGHLGQLTKQQGRLKDARAYMQESLQLRQNGRSAISDDRIYRLEVIGARWQLAKIDFQLQDYDYALEQLKDCYDELITIADQQDLDYNVQQNAALIANDYAIMLLYLERPAEALPIAQASLERLEKLRGEIGDSMRYIERLSVCITRMRCYVKY